MFTHDPRSAKVLKGFESPSLQGRVNSPGSSIFAAKTLRTGRLRCKSWNSSSRVGLGSSGCDGLFSISGCRRLVWEMVAYLKCALISLIELEGTVVKGMVRDRTVGMEPVSPRLFCSSLKVYHLPSASSVVSDQDEPPSSVGLDFRARLDGGRIVEVTKLTTGRLVNGLSYDGIDMVIKHLDFESKVDAMMRDFL
ncbi:hypothetical protein Tco_1442464, partial [Tanacetum coccineum]